MATITWSNVFDVFTAAADLDPLGLPPPVIDHPAAAFVAKAPGPVTSGAGHATSNIADLAMHGNIARPTYGVAGTGITIGIISDNFDASGTKAAAAIALGDLPATGVIVYADNPAGHDEGRGMAELVHKVARGAHIDFASGDVAYAGYASGIAGAIARLTAAGCQVIVDDLTEFPEPDYQLGTPEDNAIDAAVAKGVSYFTAVGNIGQNYFEDAFSTFTTTVPGLTGTFNAVNFSMPSHPQSGLGVVLEPGTIAKPAKPG